MNWLEIIYNECHTDWRRITPLCEDKVQLLSHLIKLFMFYNDF